jgi:hypothetical protein
MKPTLLWGSGSAYNDPTQCSSNHSQAAGSYVNISLTYLLRNYLVSTAVEDMPSQINLLSIKLLSRLQSSLQHKFI